MRDLQKLSHGGPRTKSRSASRRPLAELSGYYDEANDRYGIGQNYLAAINHVETKFGRVKSDSVAGAQGPMQFIPSTWEIYGNGGDIKDPHDAILAAANLLRDNGAPADYRRALRAYNNSGHYVDAVTALREADQARPLRHLLPLLLGALGTRRAQSARFRLIDPSRAEGEMPRWHARPRSLRSARVDSGSSPAPSALSCTGSCAGIPRFTLRAVRFGGPLCLSSSLSPARPRGGARASRRGRPAGVLPGKSGTTRKASSPAGRRSIAGRMSSIVISRRTLVQIWRSAALTSSPPRTPSSI